MIDKVLLMRLLEEKKVLEKRYKDFVDDCKCFDDRLCECLGVPKGTAIKHEDILKILLDEENNDNE